MMLRSRPCCWATLADRFVAPTFERNAIAWAGTNARDALKKCLATGQLTMLEIPAWNELRAGLDAHFGTGTVGQCLGCAPHAWTTFYERQVTEGLAYFLSELEPEVRRRRVWALLDALAWPGTTIAFDRVTGARAISEAKAPEGQRIDLLAWVEDDKGSRLGAVVEAKFEHTLSERQLRSYRRAASSMHRLDLARSTFTVVAPARTSNIRDLLAVRPEWRFLSWERLIVRLDERLNATGCDDTEFARFRRTIWHRAFS